MSKVDFSEPLFFLNVIGVHPSKTDQFSQLRMFVVMGAYFLGISNGVLELVLNSEGLKTYARASECLVSDFQLMFKMMVLILYRKDIAQLLEDAKKFWPLTEFGPSCFKNSVKYHILLRKIFRVYKYLIAFTCIQFVVDKIIFKKKEPICICYGESKGLEAPFDQLYFCLQTFCVVITINLINGFDGLFFYFVGHVLSEFQMVKAAFEQQWSTKEKFRLAAQHHSHVLEFTGKFNDAFSIVLLVQHMTCLFTICFSLFLMSKDGFPPDIDLLIKYTPFILSFTMQLWTFCFSGQLLSDWSLDISSEIFHNGWDFDFDYQNVLGRVISMNRGQTAARLTLGGFGDLDLESFKQVMQKTFSFYTFVNAMDLK